MSKINKTMLLILSENTDHSTSEVIRWLIFYKVAFKRINLDYPIIDISISIKSDNTTETLFKDFDNEEIKLNDFSKFWYRRGDPFTLKPVISKHKKRTSEILHSEWEIVKSFIFENLEKKPHLGSYFKERNHNKLINLILANSVGLTIPDTLITTEKNRIIATAKWF